MIRTPHSHDGLAESPLPAELRDQIDLGEPDLLQQRENTSGA
jgi:hypothetical protein